MKKLYCLLGLIILIVIMISNCSPTTQEMQSGFSAAGIENGLVGVWIGSVMGGYATMTMRINSDDSVVRFGGPFYQSGKIEMASKLKKTLTVKWNSYIGYNVGYSESGIQTYDYSLSSDEMELVISGGDVYTSGGDSITFRKW